MKQDDLWQMKADLLEVRRDREYDEEKAVAFVVKWFDQIYDLIDAQMVKSR